MARLWPSAPLFRERQALRYQVIRSYECEGPTGESVKEEYDTAGRSRTVLWRRAALTLVSILIVMLLLALAAHLQAASPTSRGARAIAQEANPTSVPSCVMGFQTHYFGLAREAGACWLRENLYWDLIEPEKTSSRTYDWTAFDTKFANMAEGGTNVIATVAANPPWAAEYPGGPVTDTTDLTDFLQAAVERYDGDGIADAPGSPRVEYWELYNEPDLQDVELASGENGRYFGFWGGRGVEYAQMLASAYAAIKEADPSAQVVFGGVAHEVVGDPPGNFDLGFVDSVMTYIRDHPGLYFDIMNFHYYVVFDVNYSSWGSDIEGKATYMRDKLLSYNIEKPMVCTEAGTWSGGGPWFRPGSHEEQSRYIVQAYSRSFAADLETTIWYLLVDSPVEEEKRGLLDLAPNRKPAFNAGRTFATRLDGATYSGSLFAYEPPQPGECWWPLPRREGYAFTLPSGQRLLIVWKNVAPWAPPECYSGEITETLQTLATQVTVLDRFDPNIETVPPVETMQPQIIHDGDDGRVDLLVTVPYTYNPVYMYIEDDGIYRTHVPNVLLAY